MRDLFNELMDYVAAWQKLDVEQNCVPKWPIYHFYKTMKILKQKEQLTEKFNDIVYNSINKRA